MSWDDTIDESQEDGVFDDWWDDENENEEVNESSNGVEPLSYLWLR